jgi:hypothetical protein
MKFGYVLLIVLCLGSTLVQAPKKKSGGSKGGGGVAPSLVGGGSAGAGEGAAGPGVLLEARRNIMSFASPAQGRELYQKYANKWIASLTFASAGHFLPALKAVQDQIEKIYISLDVVIVRNGVLPFIEMHKLRVHPVIENICCGYEELLQDRVYYQSLRGVSVFRSCAKTPDQKRLRDKILNDVFKVLSYVEYVHNALIQKEVLDKIYESSGSDGVALFCTLKDCLGRMVPQIVYFVIGVPGYSSGELRKASFLDVMRSGISVDAAMSSMKCTRDDLKSWGLTDMLKPSLGAGAGTAACEDSEESSWAREGAIACELLKFEEDVLYQGVLRSSAFQVCFFFNVTPLGDSFWRSLATSLELPSLPKGCRADSSVSLPYRVVQALVDHALVISKNNLDVLHAMAHGADVSGVAQARECFKNICSLYVSIPRINTSVLTRNVCSIKPLLDVGCQALAEQFVQDEPVEWDLEFLREVLCVLGTRQLGMFFFTLSRLFVLGRADALVRSDMEGYWRRFGEVMKFAMPKCTSLDIAALCASKDRSFSALAGMASEPLLLSAGPQGSGVSAGDMRRGVVRVASGNALDVNYCDDVVVYRCSRDTCPDDVLLLMRSACEKYKQYLLDEERFLLASDVAFEKKAIILSMIQRLVLAHPEISIVDKLAVLNEVMGTLLTREAVLLYERASAESGLVLDNTAEDVIVAEFCRALELARGGV